MIHETGGHRPPARGQCWVSPISEAPSLYLHTCLTPSPLSPSSSKLGSLWWRTSSTSIATSPTSEQCTEELSSHRWEPLLWGNCSLRRGVSDTSWLDTYIIMIIMELLGDSCYGCSKMLYSTLDIIPDMSSPHALQGSCVLYTLLMELPVVYSTI